jgi:hypothetical protein
MVGVNRNQLQKGQGLVVHRGDFLQEGSGLGSFFSGLLKKILPLAKRGIGAVLKNKSVQKVGKDLFHQGIQASTDAVADIIQGEDPSIKAKAKLASAKSQIADTLRVLPGELLGDSNKKKRKSEPSAPKSSKKLKKGKGKGKYNIFKDA